MLAALRSRFPVGDGPVGLVGASIGALPAQLVRVSAEPGIEAAPQTAAARRVEAAAAEWFTRHL